MNKDIQVLIEREAEKRALESVKLHHSDINSMNAKFEFNSIYNDVMFGVNIALSLFKWRKVSEELPENSPHLLMDTARNVYKGGKVGIIKTTQVIVRYKNNTYDIAERCKCVGDSYFWWSCHESFDKNDGRFIIEWMPIPQID